MGTEKRKVAASCTCVKQRSRKSIALRRTRVIKMSRTKSLPHRGGKLKLLVSLFKVFVLQEAVKKKKKSRLNSVAFVF